ncbi:MAG: hypothetical protein HYV06_04325 [Deltaproteobacteria bacterium]|nr:hypothetical protein [Deltaproteobacteria bacterium]
MAEIIDSYEMEMLDALRPASAAIGMNGPAFYLFCLAATKKGKPVLELTLGEITELMQTASERYEVMHNRLKTLEV